MIIDKFDFLDIFDFLFIEVGVGGIDDKANSAGLVGIFRIII